MNDPLRTAEDYELFLYELSNNFPAIKHSTLTFVRRGASLARVSGELHFDHSIRLVVRERLTFDRLPITLHWYGYEVWRCEEKLYWYDPQPIPMTPLCNPPTLTTSICPLISSTIVSRRPI